MTIAIKNLSQNDRSMVNNVAPDVFDVEVAKNAIARTSR